MHSRWWSPMFGRRPEPRKHGTPDANILFVTVKKPYSVGGFCCSRGSLASYFCHAWVSVLSITGTCGALRKTRAVTTARG